MDITRGQLLRGAAAAGLVAAAPSVTALSAAGDTQPQPHDAHPTGRYRGVGYEVGSGESPQTGWQAARMRADLRAIRKRLHANTVSVFGDGVERLTATATEAAEHGLTVFLQPRLGDAPEADILEHLAETGRAAERLRRDGARVHLSVGCEFVLFVPGIVPGQNALERVGNLLAGTFDPVHMAREVERFIALSARTGRRVFNGPLTYGAGDGDAVDWSLFDLVSVNYYGYHRRRSGYLRDLRAYQRIGKPVVVAEFGSCTFKGAPQQGGMGWYAIDYEADPPRLRPGTVRSERTQAEHLALMYGIFAELGLYASTVYSFVSPDSPHRPRTPECDYDTASYALVKTIEDADGTGWHWEPKESFHALARRWRADAVTGTGAR